MSTLAWIVVAIAVLPLVVTAWFWTALLRSGQVAMTSQARLLVQARVAELLLAALFLVLAVVTKSGWLLVPFIVLFVAGSVLRRVLRKREAASPRP